MKLFNKKLIQARLGNHRYTPTKDPNKFYMLVPIDSKGGGEFTVVVNWEKELQTK